MGVRRRNHERDNGDITASALIDINDSVQRAYLAQTRRRTMRDSRRAWKWYKSIPEVQAGVNRSARIAGYTQFWPHYVNADGSAGARITEGPAAEAARLLTSPTGGMRFLATRFYTLMKVPGEAHLIRVRDDKDNVIGYEFCAPNEIDDAELAAADGKSAIYRKTAPESRSAFNNPESFREKIKPEDYIGRVWCPDAEWLDLASSPLGASDVLCEQLDLMTKGVLARLKSRIAQAGIALIPSDITIASNLKPGQKQIHPDNVIDALLRSWTSAIRNPGDADAIVPHILRGPTASLAEVRFVTMDRDILTAEIEMRVETINRILMSLDSQQDAVKGTGDQNHFSAWAATDDERRVAIGPDMETLAFVLTTMVFREDMRVLGGADYAKVALFPDYSRALSRTNGGEDARQLGDRGLIGESAQRHAHGFGDESKPSDAEFIRWVGRITRNPVLALHGIEGAKDLDWGEVEKWGAAATGPTSDSPGEDPSAGPGVGAPGSPSGGDSDAKKSDKPL